MYKKYPKFYRHDLSLGGGVCFLAKLKASVKIILPENFCFFKTFLQCISGEPCRIWTFTSKGGGATMIFDFSALHNFQLT